MTWEIKNPFSAIMTYDYEVSNHIQLNSSTKKKFSLVPINFSMGQINL